MHMANTLKIHSLGIPALADPSRSPLTVKTRKATAILVFLLRTPGYSLPREVLADMFWSHTSREKATQSLRQALRQLRQICEETGVAFLETGNLHVSLRVDDLDWDLDELASLIGRGRAADFAAAKTLWKGDFLYGFETLDPEFSTWLLIERERIRSELVSATIKKIEGLSLVEDSEAIEAAARFLLHMDATLEHAHQILIRLHLAKGQKKQAADQLKACERELKVGLDAKPDPETYRLLENHEALIAPEDRLGPPFYGLGGGLAQTDDDEIRFPELSILSLSLDETAHSKARLLRDEIVGGLSSYRCFELVQAEYLDDGNKSSVTRVESDELGSYLLRFRHDPSVSRVYIQFECRDTGRILFNEIVDFNVRAEQGDIHAVAYHTVSWIHAHVVGRLRKPGTTTAFGRWCQAEALLWEFSETADAKALEILGGLEKTIPTFSMIYAGQASIKMKRQIYYAGDKGESGEVIHDTLALAEKGVLLDPWQSVNQRIFGWALVQAGYSEEARRAFRQAEQLNLVDPHNLMSVAEGLAFTGDIRHAREVAERALPLFPAVPRIFFEYLATIHFAAEDYYSATEFMERASAGSLIGLTTRVAALICTGREADAQAVLEAHGRRFAWSRDTGSHRGSNDLPWHRRVNLFQEPKIKASFQRGAELVQRYLSNGG
jgi:DNA-binding SARP family transcriptional activator